jgi:arylsulfatase A-like enzyme
MRKGMNRREFLAGVSATAIAVSGAESIAGNFQRGAGRSPNIIYYIADELGYFELSCMGHAKFDTPNIDRLAAEGMRFTQCLAGNAVCAPTRCCLLTGKHAGHASVRSNGTHQTLQESEATLASMLKGAGYATGGFGKWGNGNRGSAGVPEKHGFDEFFGYYDQSHAHSYYPPYLVRNGREVPLVGNEPGLQLKGRTYSHYEIVRETERWIRRHRDGPFFAYLAWTPPHGSFAIPRDDPSWRLYADKPWPEQARVYAAMVNMIDRDFGRILQMIKELGLDDNTIVMFSGDNGGNSYFADQAHPAGFFGPNVNPRTGERFRGAKGSLYEGGLRIPFIARWPGRIRAGAVSEHLCYLPDVMPTLARAAGTQCPESTDGISFMPELTGASQPRHEFLYWEFHEMLAVRTSSWKGVQPKRTAHWELYDLSRDIQEKDDLAAKHPDIIAKLQAIALEQHREQPATGVFDRKLNARDLQSVYPDRANSGIDPANPPRPQNQ